MSRSRTRSFLLTLLSFIPLVAGVTVFGVGFLYDALYAGIPYQDPPPDLERRYQANSKVASRIEGWGGNLILLGIGVVVVNQVDRRVRRR
jgi:uncharacterized protein involved in cysteine biosynthesis